MDPNSISVPKIRANTKRKLSGRSSLASEMAKEILRSEIQSVLDNFIDGASADERWFLYQVLITRASITSHITGYPEIPIASAFDLVMERGERTWLRIDDNELSRQLERVAIDWQRSGGKFLPAEKGWKLWRNEKGKA